MKRREFVKNMSLTSVGAPFMFNGLSIQGIGKELFATTERSAEDKILVIIRLGGGNDGLNTLIPLDQYDKLVIQRPNVIVPQSALLPITDTLALHPAMTGMQSMYGAGKLSIIQNVGYPEQNRSHFRSTDIWNSGLMDQAASTGWMGRNFDNLYPNFPSDYPNDNYPDPFAISMGSQVSATCQGLLGNFSHCVENPFDAFSLTETGAVNDGTYFGAHMEYLTTIIGQTNAYGSEILNAANAGSTLSTLYDDNNPAAKQLRSVAQMISGGLKTKVYILNIDGFDTHDSQVSSTDVTQGAHADLLKQLSDAIHAFQDDLALLNLEHRVAGMTYSEFGRQIASNASFGTDHGDAAPLFLFGTCVGQLVVGSNPVISNQVIDQMGIPMQIDFRDVYASILKNWFEIPAANVQSLFEHQVTFYGFLNGCSAGIEEENKNTTTALLYPNPAASHTTIRFEALNEFARIELIDYTGKQIAVVYEGTLNAGSHNLNVDLSDIPSGQYLMKIQKSSGEENLKLMKVKSI